jgi:uncharacterized protein YndB with AHSA1/START domain
VADPVPNESVFRIVVQADIERVWHELTKTGEAQGAVFNAVLHARALTPGQPVQMRTGSGRHVLVVGEVLECTPPRVFAHTHRFTQHDDPVCTVRYELKPVPQGVEVTLRVIGMTPGTRSAKSMASGGHFILKNLKAVCEQGRPPLGTRLMYLMFDWMEAVLPARTKAEHWPLQA